MLRTYAAEFASVFRRSSALSLWRSPLVNRKTCMDTGFQAIPPLALGILRAALLRRIRCFTANYFAANFARTSSYRLTRRVAAYLLR
jgi:hypothetical protein